MLNPLRVGLHRVVRALSSDNERFEARKWGAQQQSRLLQLPAEIRQQIWDYMFAEQTVHISIQERKLKHAVCPQPGLIRQSLSSTDIIRSNTSNTKNGRASGDQLEDLAYVAQCDCLPMEVVKSVYIRPQKGRVENRRQALQDALRDEDAAVRVPQLPWVCKQIYNETIDMLYAHIAFTFPTQRTLSHFARSITPSNLNNIQSLNLFFHFDSYKGKTMCGYHGSAVRDKSQLGDWAKVKEVIGRMGSLQCLALIVCGRPDSGYAGFFEELQEALSTRGESFRWFICSVPYPWFEPKSINREQWSELLRLDGDRDMKSSSRENRWKFAGWAAPSSW